MEQNKYATNPTSKSRYFTAVCYPENMIDDWQEKIGELLQLPCCYIVHDKDIRDSDLDERKVHVHILVAFSNTTTQRFATKVIDQLSRAGASCMPKWGAECVISVGHVYKYMIHDTENARQKGKHLYDPSERIEVNNFDIGSYEQLSVAEQDDIFEEICDWIMENNICNFKEVHIHIRGLNNRNYLHVLKTQKSYFVELCKGNYHEKDEQRRAVEALIAEHNLTMIEMESKYGRK